MKKGYELFKAKVTDEGFPISNVFKPVFEVSRFSSVDPRHVCGLCHGVANPDGTLQCFSGLHLFCKSCIDKWQADNTKCHAQNCSSPIFLMDSEGKKVNSHVPECMVEILMKLELKCSSSGCSQKMTIGGIAEHCSKCPFMNNEVKAFIDGKLDQIKKLQILLDQSRVANFAVSQKLSDATTKIFKMTKEHELEKTALIKSHNAAITRLRDDIDELRANLDLAEDELETEKSKKRKKSSTSTPTSKSKIFIWQNHATKVDEPGSFEDNSLAKAKGHRYKCNYCDEDQLSDKQTSYIIRHMRNSHGDRLPRRYRTTDDPNYSDNQ